MSAGPQVSPLESPPPGWGEPPVAPRAALVRSLAIQAAALLVAGVVVGLAWAASGSTVAGWSDGIEREISPEVTLAVLGGIAGLVTAVVGLVRPGRYPLPGAVVRLVGSVAAALVAWGTGRLAGAPVLVAPGAALLWPLTTALVTALVTLAVVLVAPER